MVKTDFNSTDKENRFKRLILYPLSVDSNNHLLHLHVCLTHKVNFLYLDLISFLKILKNTKSDQHLAKLAYDKAYVVLSFCVSVYAKHLIYSD